jgi:hypothetical protein
MMNENCVLKFIDEAADDDDRACAKENLRETIIYMK